MKKQQWMAVLLGGCLLLGLAACKQSDSSAQEEDTTKSYAEDIQKKKDAEAAEQAKQDEAKQEETKQEETKPAEENSSSEKKDDDAKPNDTEKDAEQDDANQDGEARNEISKSEAKASVIAQFGSADENGQTYEYSLDGIEQIGSRKYYIYRMSWAADDQDGGAYSKTLKYIFVATDGSTIHTGTADDDGYDIDYSS